MKVKCAGGQRPGTGDVFASVAAGALLRGASLKEAVEQAARFVKDCIHISDELDIPHANGVCFEEILGKLVKKIECPFLFAIICGIFGHKRKIASMFGCGR